MEDRQGLLLLFRLLKQQNQRPQARHNCSEFWQWTRNAAASGFGVSKPSGEATNLGGAGKVPSKKPCSSYPSVINMICCYHCTNFFASNFTVSWRGNTWIKRELENDDGGWSTDVEFCELAINNKENSSRHRHLEELGDWYHVKC